MNQFLSVVFIFSFSILVAQTPGGVLGEDLWYKTSEETVSTNTFQDYGSNNYPISKSGTIQSNLFNFNPSLNFEGGSLSFPYSVEDMKVATIFMVYTYPSEANLSLIHSDWTTGGFNGNGFNEKKFSYTTQKLEKEDFSLNYPEEEQEIPNALINTLNWFDFNSNHINHAMGTGGESTVFVGKANEEAAYFSGSIPEFLIYRKALSKEERQRIESYLAIKYGITLTSDVGYFNSNYDEIWEKDYNDVFGNRVFAIGRDDVSGLYQKQSKSSHTENDELILNVGALEQTNDENTAEIGDNHFIFIGDNNGADNFSESVGDWQLHQLDRVWLVHPYGEVADTLATELRYNATHLFNRIHQDYDQEFWDDIGVWILINRNANQQQEGNFDFNQVEAYQYHATEGEHIVYYDQRWDENQTGFDQFTFAIAPKMLVKVSLQAMECEDEEGNIDVEITFGEPNFDFDIYDENDLLVASQNNWVSRTISFTDLPNGWYTLKVRDSTNYEREVVFEVSPTAGMFINLEDVYTLNPDVTIDASEYVTAQGITYQWFLEDELFTEDPVLLTNKPGHYKVILTNPMGCTVEAETDIVIVGGLFEKDPQKEVPSADFAKGEIKIYPNPTRANQEFTVEIHLMEKQEVQIQIHDVSGRLIHTEKLKNISNYQWNHRIFQAGSYLISVMTQDEKFIKKLIIQ